MASIIDGTDNFDSGTTVLQVVNFQTGAVASGTTLIPIDDTIPQITEGTEFMTLAITPKSATSILYIDVVAQVVTATNGTYNAGALFVGATANALASMYTRDGNANYSGALVFKHKMVAGVTTGLTFRVRCGANAASTMTFNGVVSSRRYGGTLASSITITEVAA